MGPGKPRCRRPFNFYLSFVFVDEILLALRVIYAGLLSALIGVEREYSHKPAGLRTHILVGMGAALFGVLSPVFGGDPSRIAAYVVAGIGFIGGGTIIQTQNKVQGITTAASLWLTAAVGLAAGAGLYVLALISAIAGLATLSSRLVLKKARR